MRGKLNVSGQHVLPKGGVFTVPNSKATADVFAVSYYDDPSKPDAVALRGESVGGPLGFTRYIVPHNFQPGVGTFQLTASEVDLTGVPFSAHPAVANDPRELVAHIGGLPGGGVIDWDTRADKMEVFSNAAELRWGLRGVTKGSGPKFNAQLHLDMARDQQLVDFTIGIACHDEKLGAWFAEGGRPVVSFPEAEVVQMTVEMQSNDRRNPDGPAAYWQGGMLVIRGTLVCTKAEPPIFLPTGPNDELEPIEEEEEFPWQNDGTVGNVYMRLDGGEWDGFAGATRAVLADIADDSALPRIYLSAGGARNVDRTPQTGGREAFGIALDTAAFVSSNLYDVFRGLERGLLQEALRPIHWFDGEGFPLDVSTRPNCTTYNSVPDWRLGSDRLGLPDGWFQDGGLSAQDEAHLTQRYALTLYFLTGDRLAREILFAQMNVLYASRHDYIGQPRAFGRDTLFAAHMLEVLEPGSEWHGRMKAYAAAKCATYLERMRWVDQQLGLAPEQWKTEEVYVGDSSDHPAGYAAHLDETWGIAGFMVSLSILGPLVLTMRYGDEICPTELLDRLVKVGDSVMKWNLHERQDPVYGDVLEYSYVMGWNGGRPITDRTPGKHISKPGLPSYAVRGTLFPLAYAVINYGKDAEAQRKASKLIAVDPDSFGNARWRAIDASLPAV